MLVSNKISVCDARDVCKVFVMSIAFRRQNIMYASVADEVNFTAQALLLIQIFLFPGLDKLTIAI